MKRNQSRPLSRSTSPSQSGWAFLAMSRARGHVGRLMRYITLNGGSYRFWSRGGSSDGNVYVVEHEWRIEDAIGGVVIDCHS